jgi:hypothetical protein
MMNDCVVAQPNILLIFEQVARGTRMPMLASK